MHSVMRSDFLNRFLSLDRFQRDSRLHVCAEAPPLPRFHSAPFRGSRFYTLFTGPNFGEQLTLSSFWGPAQILLEHSICLFIHAISDWYPTMAVFLDVLFHIDIV